MKQIFTILMFSVLIIGTACSSKSQEETNDVSEQVQPTTSTTSGYVVPQTSTNDQPYQSSASTRSDAYQLAFNSGKQLGYSDGQKGMNDCYSAASAYSDDWIKQAFIQGYELGQAEAGSNSSVEEYKEVEYDDEDYYYDGEY